MRTVAMIEGYYSRPMAPTRRLSLGAHHLPTGSDAVLSRILLGGVVAEAAARVDEDTAEQFGSLLASLAAGERIAQPTLRHRLQQDKVGLQRCRHRLVQDGDELRYRLRPERGTPSQHLLCAAYAAAGQPPAERAALFAALAKGSAWTGDIDDRLIAHLADRRVVGAAVAADPVSWALGVLDLGQRGLDDRHPDDEIRAAFRAGLRAAHPDHGAAEVNAAARIAELREARDILLRA